MLKRRPFSRSDFEVVLGASFGGSGASRLGLWEPADSAGSQDEEFSHALEPLRGPADPKGFAPCRRPPAVEGLIGRIRLIGWSIGFMFTPNID